MIDTGSAAEAYRRNYGEPEINCAAFTALCAAACAELSPLVREGADFSDIRLLNLAASLVRYALTVRESEGEGSLVTFKAGDVAVGTDANARLKRALDEKNLRYEAALPLLKDSGFCFMQVRI